MNTEKKSFPKTNIHSSLKQEVRRIIDLLSLNKAKSLNDNHSSIKLCNVDSSA